MPGLKLRWSESAGVTTDNLYYMESLLGFKMDGWDYATFAVLALLVLAGLITVVWLTAP